VQLTFDFPKATVTIRGTKGEFHEKPNWIERLLYHEEVMRGESAIDDCYQPGYFEITVSANSESKIALITTGNETNQENIEVLNEIGSTMPRLERALKRELEQRSNLLASFYASHATLPMTEWLSWILLAADTFIVRSLKKQESVIAGYHWFEPWGRDTFISLPGLMLVTGRYQNAKNVLSHFNAHCRHGLIPNFLQDNSGEASYNTVDATLWFVNAVLQYLKYTGDFKFVQTQLWETLKSIIESHIKGTLFDIHMDNDGLLAHGSRLTWMDAEIDGVAVTPRAGKAVEIQALWYNTLRIGQLLANKFEEKNLTETYATLAGKIQGSFNAKFWNGEGNCLFDVLKEAGDADASCRPNQVIAGALDFPVLNGTKNAQIVDIVEREFLTPCGLRTLARSDPRYKGVYAGDRRSRDQAYHNGAVWPWLLGPFVTAFLKAKDYKSENRSRALQSFVEPLFTQQVAVKGLGTISEIFDGDEPHLPKGCIAQAWSVAEPLRVYVEDVMMVRPEHEKEVLRVQ
jgi:predicted glycogen debranching enzyme